MDWQGKSLEQSINKNPHKKSKYNAIYRQKSATAKSWLEIEVGWETWLVTGAESSSKFLAFVQLYERPAACPLFTPRPLFRQIYSNMTANTQIWWQIFRYEGKYSTCYQAVLQFRYFPVKGYSLILADYGKVRPPLNKTWRKKLNLLWLTLMQMSCQRNEDQSAGDSQFILIVHHTSPNITSLYTSLQ